MAKKWSEIESISAATDTHEFVVIKSGFSKRISKQNFLKELVAKNTSQDGLISGLSSSVSANANNISLNAGKVSILESKNNFTSEFAASNPDVLTTVGHYTNTHASLPFGLEGAVINVIEDSFTNKLWQFLTPTEDEISEGYRIQDTTIGTWLAWVETNPQHDPEFLGTSLATTQEPATTNTPIQIEFGVAQVGNHNHADLAIDGTVTFNDAGKYRIALNAHFGRSGSSGVSLLFGRFLYNGVPYGSTIHALMDDDDVLNPYSSTFTILAETGSTLSLEIYRDSGGNNSGGLFSAQPALSGWALSPTASISVTKV